MDLLHGSHNRGYKRSRPKSLEKQELMLGEGKYDSGSKTASRLGCCVSASSSFSGGLTSSQTHID